MPSCTLCKNEGRISREDVIYTLKRTGLSTMTDGSVTLADVKEHRFPLCGDCARKETRFKLAVGVPMLTGFIAGFVVMMTRDPEDDLWFVGLGAMIVSLAAGFFALKKLSPASRLKAFALNDRNIPGYTAMAKGEYEAFAKAAKWDRGEFD